MINSTTRRSVLTAGIITAAATTVGGASKLMAEEVLSGPLPLNISDPRDNVYMIVKIQGDVSGKPTVSWEHGHVFGIKDGAMAQPLLRYQSVRIGTYTQQTDASFLFRYRGAIFYQDYETGEFIEKFENPYTGRTVDVRNWRSSIGEMSYTDLGPKGSSDFNGNSGKPHGEPYLLQWNRVGNLIWTTLDERVVYQRPIDKVWRRDNAILRYESRWDELVDPNCTSASASTSFQTHIDWFTWLEMEDLSGGMMQGGMGRKFSNVDQLSHEFVSAAERIFPGILYDPIA